MQGFKERKQALLDTLQDNAGEDSLKDRFTCGYLAAINDILNIDVEEVSIDD